MLLYYYTTATHTAAPLPIKRLPEILAMQGMMLHRGIMVIRIVFYNYIVMIFIAKLPIVHGDDSRYPWRKTIMSKRYSILVIL